MISFHSRIQMTTLLLDICPAASMGTRPANSFTVHWNTRPAITFLVYWKTRPATSFLVHWKPSLVTLTAMRKRRYCCRIQSQAHAQPRTNIGVVGEEEGEEEEEEEEDDEEQPAVNEGFKSVNDEEDIASTSQINKPSATTMTKEVTNSVKLLKAAAKTRKVPMSEVVSALGVLKNAKLKPLNFLKMLGGNESPGRTWMLIFTAQGKSGQGYYFPITAVQRFDASAMKIENGIYLGPIGCLTFEGRFSWKERMLAFIFESLNLKIGPLGPLKINVAKEQDKDRTPVAKDPFFIWFYVDEEIAVAQGKSGGTALWCRCTRVA